MESPNIFNWKPTNKTKVGVVVGEKFRPNQALCCEKSKETGIIIDFSHILHAEYISKQEAVAVKTPGQKYKANIARNITFEGRQATFLFELCQK